GLLARKAALAEQLDHLEEGVARRQRQILALLGPILADRHSHGGNEVGGRRPFRPREEAGMGEARPADRPPRRLAGMQAEAQRDGGAHLDRADASLAVALRKM